MEMVKSALATMAGTLAALAIFTGVAVALDWFGLPDLLAKEIASRACGDTDAPCDVMIVGRD